LRQPLEDKTITRSRARGSIKYPSDFTLIAASNPCPCGYKNSEIKECICNLHMLDKYKKKISGPIMDRIDMVVFVKAIEIKKITDQHLAGNESSRSIKSRVVSARKIQKKRFCEVKNYHSNGFHNNGLHTTRQKLKDKNQQKNLLTNSQLNSKQVRKFCQLTPQAELILKKAANKLAISTRSYFKIIKVAHTIAEVDSVADLNFVVNLGNTENHNNINEKHVAEALRYRGIFF
jgi:magnesium chelatase family protein